MCEKVQLKTNALRLGLATAITAVLVMVLPLQAFASGSNGIHHNGTNNDDTISGKTQPGDPKVYTMYGDAWEVTMYIHEIGGVPYKTPCVGSFMLYGDKTRDTAQRAASDDIKFITQLDWGKSNGTKNSINNTGGGIHKRYRADCPGWKERERIIAWGTNEKLLHDFVMEQLIQQGDLDEDIAEKIYNQLEAPPPLEDWEAGIADGTLIDWCVTMEPIQLLYFKTCSVGNGQIVGADKYDFNKREEHYVEWAIPTQRASAWEGICTEMSQPEIAFNEEGPIHNQPHSWTTDKGWGGYLNKAQDNYYIFYPKFNSEPTPKIPTPPETDFSPIWILEKEILANIPVDWDKDDGTKSNILAENIEQIKIKEKTNTKGGLRIHENKNGGSCGYVEHDDDEDGNCTSGCKTCTETMWDGVKCDQDYVFTWDINPTSKLNEEKLVTWANISGQASDLDNPFEGTDPPTKYQMTRVGEDVDLKFSIKNDVFKEYTWQNTHAGGKQTIDHSGKDNYSSTTDEEATPMNEDPEPFNAGFQVSFNSHRFAKYGAKDDEDLVSVAGGEQAILPLAGYMMDTQANKDYDKWMSKRGLFRRVEWTLDETNGTFIDGMYKGDPGRNFTWGHGGDHGTGIETDPSDLVWNNSWAWSRTAVHGEHIGVQSATHGGGHKVEINHGDTCKATEGSSGSGISADALKSPRACFGRTEIIEDTIRGHKNTNLLRGTYGDYPTNRTEQFDNSGSGYEEEGVRYFMRQNSWNNDRVTFTIPSTIFEFSPTYKMYADYTLNTTRADYEDVWMLASDTDTVQFRDVIDFDLQGGDTVVRAPWSRDYDDARAADPNTDKPINVLKSGSAYHVDTSNSRLVITAVIHHWDLDFFEPGSEAWQSASRDNEIREQYMENITGLMRAIKDQDFGFYTNLVGGTTETSRFRTWTNMNPEIFQGKEFKTRTEKKMEIPEPTVNEYPKLRLTVNVNEDNPYVKGKTIVTPTDYLSYYRLDGGWTVWDSIQAKATEDEIALWTDPVIRTYIPDMEYIHSATRLETVLVKGMGTVEKWYIEDYEGILITVVQGYVDIPAVRSNPATVYEKLSDFNSDMNQWSPPMRHPIIQVDGYGARGFGDNIIIPKGSVGAGTYLQVPPLTIYPDGVQSPDGPGTIENWEMCYEPYLFGLRGSLFDNAA